MALHISRGTGAPTNTPSSYGQHYINTTNGDIYFSNGTASVANWVGPLGNVDISGKENVGVAASLDATHLSNFTHADIAHTNRTALNAVSGVNTGDQIISDATISTSDITTNNASVTKHGFFPKLPTPTGKYLKDDLTWGTPASGSSNVTIIGTTALDFNYDCGLVYSNGTQFLEKLDMNLDNGQVLFFGNTAGSIIYAGDPITIYLDGTYSHPSFGSTIGTKIYWSAQGISTTRPTGYYVYSIGIVVSPSTIKVEVIREPSVLYQSADKGWKDLTTDIVPKGSGANDPAMAVFRNGLQAPSFSPTTTQQFWAYFHLDHDYAVGTPIHLHIHWSPNTTSAGVVLWGFEYSIAKGHQQVSGSVFGATTTVTVAQTVTLNTDQYKHFVAEHSAGITSSLFEPDTIIMVRGYRDATNAQDTFPDVVFGYKIDCHYQTNGRATKNKAPNFYA